MAKKSEPAAKAPEDANSSGDPYNVEMDAMTLKNAAEIHADSDRHQAALDHLTKQSESIHSAVKNSKRKLQKKVGDGLKKAFSHANPDEEKEGKEESEEAE